MASISDEYSRSPSQESAALISVLTCIGTRHDPWLVMLAALICCSGCYAAMQLFTRAVAATGTVKRAWTFLAALVAGGAIWCTHFVAMLAYLADAPIAYDPVLTITSLIVAIGGMMAGLEIAGLDRPVAAPAVGGAILGVSITAMHYTGMLAYRVSGIVRWNPDMVTGSGLFATFLASVAMVTARGQYGRSTVGCGTCLLTGAVLALHFTGMTALEIIPLGRTSHVFDGGTIALAIATATVAGVIILAGAFAYFIDVSAQRTAQARISAIAKTDFLTGLPDRAGFNEELIARLGTAVPGDNLMLAKVKLEGFGAIVERYGSRIADLTVNAVVARIQEAKASGIVLARTGFAEFAALGPAPPLEELRAAAQLLIDTLIQPMLIEFMSISVDPRIGFAFFPADATEADELMGCSRLALNRALCDPLEPVSLYDELQDGVARRRQVLASDLRLALDRNQLELHYQPQVRIVDRAVVGHEALLRWIHPELGNISPAEFIPIAERTGQIVAMGDWALQHACVTATHWPGDWHVAVNVSPLQLRQPDLPQRILTALVQSGLSPHRLEIELTESLLVDDRPRALHILRAIKALGVRLSLDDFGTGYSSLDVLRHFPFDKIKLDKTFVDDVERNPQSRAILNAVLEMGRSLDIPVLTEGVETEHQLAILQSEGCQIIQGYLTGRPVPANDILVPVKLSQVGRLG